MAAIIISRARGRSSLLGEHDPAQLATDLSAVKEFPQASEIVKDVILDVLFGK